MKALYKPAAAPGFEFTERPEPEAGPGEVKIRVLRTGICGTDLHIEAWDAWAAGAVNAPLVAGHEFCGEVVAVGPGVRDVRVGDLVSGEGHIVCGTCRNCRAGRRHLCIRTSGVGVNRDGAFAEYVVLPESNVWVHHEDVDPDLGAIFDPFGNAVHTALSFPLVGEDVLITGAGPIGLMAAEVARHVGRPLRGDHRRQRVPPRRWPARWAPTSRWTSRTSRSPTRSGGSGWSRASTSRWR